MPFLLVVLTLFLPAIAHANVGIPVVAVGLPFMVVNLVFVVLIEAFVLKRFHVNLDGRTVVKKVFGANLLTTLLGYPLVAIILALTVIFGLHLGWLLPFEDLYEKRLYIGMALFMTLVPCYFLSVWIEGHWLKRRLSQEISWKSCFTIHLVSYLFLTAQAYIQYPIHPLDYGKYTLELFYPVVIGIIRLFGGG